MSLTPSDSNRASLQEDLGRVLEQLSKLEIGSLPAEINTTVDCVRASVHGSSRDETGKVLALTVLAAALQKRYQISISKDPSDLDEAVDVTRAAVEITIREPQEFAIDDSQVYFINLERALCFKYEETKGEAQIEESVAIVVPLLDLVQQGSQFHAFTLKILSSLYSAGYNRTKTPEYLDEAINATNSAIAITPEYHPFGTVMRQVLAQLHDQRFERTNLLSELDSFISTLQELPEAQKDTLEQFEVIHELACAFERRHKLTGNIKDLEKAVKYGAAAVKIAPKSPLKGHPISARDVGVYNLRIHTKDYFRKTGDVPELDEHILKGAGIVEMLVNMDSENKTQQRYKIANAFQKLYERTNRVSDIEHALRFTMDTMQLIDDSQDEWGAIQDTFKAQFRLWSEHTGKMPDCEVTIMAFERNGGTYIPPESTEDLDLRVPYMIFSGELPVE
ncbi:uncharacterized protein EURHEDRAFT_416880 [Aspergillus ruber CBS 135680]|uniref:Uncharacterized protein n=1 Tax=Aspergillus ruber (strain CBS 135680) TaxID=1388766 RepID=A0A017S1M9_ASPRC|nr:uncharacterized protein EURHEDRAFT_416880 [Aspergillus ruber CBS 135680]EYE90963.1 hypothetical protein EURHEDRAFT_416880 [Aspergillus ruber CBS 135680]